MLGFQQYFSVALDRREGSLQIMGDVGDPFFPGFVGFRLQPVAFPDFLIQCVQALIKVRKNAFPTDGEVSARSNLPNGDGKLFYGFGSPETIENA